MGISTPPFFAASTIVCPCSKGVSFPFNKNVSLIIHPPFSIINNKFNITDILFTEDEIVAITKDVDLINYENISNRHQLHQNITDNPEIMIKAQFIYMNYIGNKCDYLASSSLFGYNRGHAFVKKNYKDSIISAAKHDLYYEIEGIGYVDKIFKFLIKYFGYNDLKKDYDD